MTFDTISITNHKGADVQVVVVGGGFGGVKTALELSKRQIGKVTLISDRSYFLHHASLYATATGRSTEESVIPLAHIFASHPNVEVIEDHIKGFDPHRRLISGKKKDYHYDILVLALGSVTSFFNVAGGDAHAYGISTLKDVYALQEHIHDEVVAQKLDKEYFVIGAGLIGVELASALQAYLKNLKELYRLKYAQPKVVLVEAQSRILPRLSRRASRKVHTELRRQGVKVLADQKVTSLNDHTITIEGRMYQTTTAIWTSASSNNPFFKANAGYFNMSRDGRVNVNPYLEALERVYVIGDNSTMEHDLMARPALRQAKHVARNIVRVATKRPQRAYVPQALASSLPVGDRWAYIEWHGLTLSGQFGRMVRRWMELYTYCQLLPFHEALPVWRAHDIKNVDSL